MSDTEFKNLQAIVKVGKVVPVPEALVDHSTTGIDSVDLSSLLEDVDLTDDEKQLLKFKLEGMTYSQIAEHYSLSRETMRKRVHKVVEKIRSKVKGHE